MCQSLSVNNNPTSHCCVNGTSSLKSPCLWLLTLTEYFLWSHPPCHIHKSSTSQSVRLSCVMTHTEYIVTELAEPCVCSRESSPISQLFTWEPSHRHHSITLQVERQREVRLRMLIEHKAQRHKEAS